MGFRTKFTSLVNVNAATVAAFQAEACAAARQAEAYRLEALILRFENDDPVLANFFDGKARAFEIRAEALGYDYELEAQIAHYEPEIIGLDSLMWEDMEDREAWLEQYSAEPQEGDDLPYHLGNDSKGFGDGWI